MIASRPGSSSPPHAAISSNVRPQPMQSALRGSITQIWTQGVEDGGLVRGALMRPYLGGGAPDEKAAQAGNFSKLLRRPGDIAGLAADLPPRNGGHRQSGEQRGREGEERPADTKGAEAKHGGDDQSNSAGGQGAARFKTAGACAKPVRPGGGKQGERQQGEGA